MGSCTTLGAVCTKSLVCKTPQEISDCKIDPACSMGDISGGLKDHPSEAVTMIAVVGLFVFALFKTVLLIKHPSTSTEMRKVP